LAGFPLFVEKLNSHTGSAVGQLDSVRQGGQDAAVLPVSLGASKPATHERFKTSRGANVQYVVWRWFWGLEKSLQASVLIGFRMSSEVIIGSQTRWALVAGFEIVLDFSEIMRSQRNA